MATLTKFEKLLVKKLSEGKSQREVSEDHYNVGIKPNSLSSIEKHIADLRAKFAAKTMFHLGVMVVKIKNQRYIPSTLLSIGQFNGNIC